MKAYCFVPEEKIEEIIECGIELSLGQHFPCKVTTNGGMCFMTKLNPRDYSKSQFVPGKILVKVNLDKVRGFIGEGTYLELGNKEDGLRMFEDSLIVAADYRLGMYRNPYCLIVNTILPEAVERYDNLMDEAVPYVTSEELYVDCIYAELSENTENFKEIAVKACFDKLAESKESEKTTYDAFNIYKTATASYVIKKG